MAEKTIADLLRETFPAVSRADWKHTAGQEIDGQNPDEQLAWKNADSLTFLPYYDQHDVATLNYLEKFRLQPAPERYAAPRHWINMPEVAVTNAVTANKGALAHLQQGAEGVLFDIQNESVDFESLMNEIEWTYCSVNFKLGSAKNLHDLQNFILQKKSAADSLNAVIFWNTLPDTKDFLFKISSQKNIRTLGIVVPPSSPGEELANALTQGVNWLEKISSDENKIAAFHNISFSLTADHNFLMNIAKLKALRILWYQVACAYGWKDYNPSSLQIHVLADPKVSEAFQPHGNMLKGTLAGLSSAIGGCNLLTLVPEDKDNTMMTRIARNVSTILRVESQIDKVSDAAAGAYAIDKIIDEVAATAWKKFQNEVQK